MFSRSLSPLTAQTEHPTQSTLGWELGNFVLNNLLKGDMAISLGDNGEILSENDIQPDSPTTLSCISPINLNLQLSNDCHKESTEFLLDLLTVDFENLLHEWMQRPLGDVYWNRQLIEQLDEGSLTKLAFLVSSNLKKPRRHYRHFAELSINEASLNKLSLLSGLGVTDIVFSVSLMQINTQLTSLIFNAVNQAKDAGLEDIRIHLSYDAKKIDAHELVRLFLDLPQLGEHELLLNPVTYKNGLFFSVWGQERDLMVYVERLKKIRHFLTSQGYRASSLGRFSLTEKTQKPPFLYFDSIGLPRALSPDFIGVGPGALSRLGSYKIFNYSLDPYISNLASDLSPRETCEKLDHYFLSLEPEIIELINSHKLNLNLMTKIVGKAPLIELLYQVKIMLGRSAEITPDHLFIDRDSMEYIPLLCSKLTQQYFSSHASQN